jgi:hypothetical protein
MLPVLDLDPVRRSAAAIDAVTALGDQPPPAGVPEQVGADLALFEIAEKNPVDAPVRSI